MRTRAKAKTARNNTILKGTGGGVPASEVITPIEADIVEFISPTCSFGIQEISESQVSEIVEETVLPSPIDNSIFLESAPIPTATTTTPIKKSKTPFLTKSGQRSATKRLQASISAVQDINSTIKERSSYQQEYYTKKIELLQQQVEIQEKFCNRMSAAIERIADAAERQGKAVEDLTAVINEFI